MFTNEKLLAKARKIKRKAALRTAPKAGRGGVSGAADLKDRLLATAIELLAQKSASELSLREVARRCGVSEAAPYRHFEDKEALLATIAAEGFHYLREYLEQALEVSGDFNDQFMASGLMYLQMGQKHPQHLKLMFGPFVTPSEKYMDLFIAGKRAFLTLARIVMNGQSAGRIGPGDPFHRAMHYWMAVHGFTMLVIDFRCGWLGIEPENAENAMRVFATDLMAGMKAPLEAEKYKFKTELDGLSLELLKAAGIDAKLTLV